MIDALLLGLVGLVLIALLFAPKFGHSGVRFILWVPIVNAIADITTNYFPASTLSTGSLRTLYILIVLYICAGRFKFKKTTLFIYLFCAYVLLLVPMSSSVSYSVQNYLKLFLSMMMFPVGYYFIRSKRNFELLNYYLYAGAAFLISQIILAQFFKLGRSDYAEDTLYLSGGKVQITYYLVLCCLAFPLLYPLLRTGVKKMIGASLAVGSLLTVILVLRRGAILGLLIGVVAFLFFTPRRTRTVRILLIVSVLLAVIYPVYAPILEARFAERSEKVIQEEGRWVETFAVFEEFRTGTLPFILIGNEALNSPDYFEKNKNQYSHRLYSGRQLHVDFNILLLGTGITGLLMYFIVYFSIVRQHNIAYRLTRANQYISDVRAVFLALVICSLVISISGGLVFIGYRSTLFLYLGSIVGITETYGLAAIKSAKYEPLLATHSRA